MESHQLKYEKELAIKAGLSRMEAYLADRIAQFGLFEQSVALTDCTIKSKEVQLDAIQLDDLEPANPKLDDSLAEV